jgi:RNA polymerase sigma factor (sigma-70 family)
VEKCLSQIPTSFDVLDEGKIKGECVQRMDVRGEDNRTIYDRFAYPVSKYICRYLPNKQDAEDLLVEVFLAAFNNKELSSFSAERQLAWLIRVTRNKLIDRRRRMALLSMVPIDLAQAVQDNMPTPEQYVQQQESNERLYRALQQLTPLQRELIQLRYTRNMNYVAIAGILGKSEEAVRQMHSRTLRQLRGIYQQIEGGKP